MTKQVCCVRQFVNSARNLLVLAARSAPELSSRASNKTTNVSLSAPTFAREYRRWMPVSSRSVLQAVPRTEEPKNERKKARKRNAERRVSNLRTLAGCGARRALRARLSASHHGTCCSERTPQLNPSYALPGTGLGRSGRYPLPAVLQCSGPKTADRSSCRPGVYAKVARVRR